jgi:carbon-monoxide dehydrogenase medium subunit
MKPAPFTYHDPRSLGEAVALLGRLDNAKPLAGGQSLMPMLNMRYVMVDHVVDLNGVAELAYVRASADGIAIGAMTRQRQLEKSPELAERFPLLVEALRHVGHFQTRNRGTIGGSLCHLDPAAELPGVCLAHDATLVIAGPNGTRRLGIADWPRFSMTPSLEPDELLAAIELPFWPAGHGHAFLEIARRHGDFAIVGVATLIGLDATGRIARAAIVLVGAAATPLRLAAAEETLMGEAPTPELFRAAASQCERIDALSDAQTPAEYRRRVAGVLVGRALGIAVQRAAEQRA